MFLNKTIIDNDQLILLIDLHAEYNLKQTFYKVCSINFFLENSQVNIQLNFFEYMYEFWDDNPKFFYTKKVDDIDSFLAELIVNSLNDEYDNFKLNLQNFVKIGMDLFIDLLKIDNIILNKLKS